MQKTVLENSLAANFMNFSPVLLVSSIYDEKANICPVSWTMPISFSPPIVAISLGHRRFSHYVIENSRQFVLNIPDESLLSQVRFCGSVSGQRKDKFMESGLTKQAALKVHAPLVDECFAHIECQVFRTFDVGDHTIFCGTVLSVLAEKDVLDANRVIDLSKRKPIIHLGHDDFMPLGGTGF